MPTDPLEIRLAVLDWAGTVIDFGCVAPAGAFVATFAARGVAVTLPEARGPMGLHKKDHLRAMLRTESVGAKWRAATGREWAEADVVELYRDVTPRQVGAAQTYSALVPGATEVVAALRRAGVKIAGTTGYFHEAAAVVAAAAKSQGYAPDFNICADDVPAGRPAPWMVFRCMEALGVYPPAAVLKVGDTVIDIEDGRNAGCWSVGVVDTSNEMGLTEAEFAALPDPEKAVRRRLITDRYLAAGAHGVIGTLTELPGLVRSLNARLASGARPG
ncbi:phosphonoacetaldehyde hydrolase [Frigoriglobus tundricola]|uniref:Phosphonoacetaldehyde hydrolase n=1 Tax=Frigoriglobus tundricola TaxID=2774151 RepID=A0A6M5YKC2_9BACT|nr:phosphonoacetaldehyde hydrolase [Frigoriglobus tundricola]QJW94519.1 Phosphonoacetaldehyde hydrolase [Frigoriglobus tundricola]